MEAAATTEVDFKSYDEIENHYSKPQLEFVEEHNGEELWVATEKIHGTNFCLISDGEDMTCSKRTSLLKENDKFYNFQSVVKPLKEKANAVFQSLQKEVFPNLQLLRIYGELFGGVYPDQESTCKAVQQGVYYATTLEFEAFDVYVELSNGQKHYMDYKLGTEHLKRQAISYAEVLYEGTLKNLMTQLVEEVKVDTFQSTIYLKHGLPKLESNNAEGFVVKQNLPVFIDDEVSRHSIKVKSKNFSETAYVKQEKPKKVKKEVTLSAEQESEKANILAIAVGYITKNRFDGIISKMTEDERSHKKVKALLVQDAMKDFEKEEDAELVKKSKKLKGAIMPALSQAAVKIVTENLPPEEE